MQRFIRMSVFALACFGCAAQAARAPEWISTLPSDNSHVYAVGMASLADAGSEAGALSAAGEAAKAELVTTLRANVQSTQQSKSTLAVQRKGEKEKSTFREEAEKNTVITTRARDLPGLKVTETHVDTAGGSAYALAVLDLSAAAGEIDRRRVLNEKESAALRAAKDPSLADFGDAEQILRGNAETLELASLLVSRLGRQGEALRNADRDLRKALADRKKSVGFGLSGSTRFDTTALREAVNGAGFAWSASPRYTFALSSRTDPDADFAYNRYVIKGQLSLQMLDRDGSVVKTSKIAGQGAGSSPEKARASLQRYLDSEVISTVKGWLGGAADTGEDSPAGSNDDEDRSGLTPGSDDRPADWSVR